MREPGSGGAGERGSEGATHLIALFQLVVPVGIWEVDMTSRVLHHLLDVVASLPYHMGVFRVGHVHL